MSKQLIFDFCDWLGDQGCAYETIYYGSEENIKELIDEYFDKREKDEELQIFKEKTISELKKYYNAALKFRTPIKELDYGDDIGYWNGVKQTIEKICKELEIDLND